MLTGSFIFGDSYTTVGYNTSMGTDYDPGFVGSKGTGISAHYSRRHPVERIGSNTSLALITRA